MIAPNVVSGELLGSAKSARKTVEVLTGARVLRIHEPTEDRCFGKHSSEPMAFATFQAFEVFRLFDNSLTHLPLPPSTPSYLTAVWFALVDESVDELEELAPLSWPPSSPPLPSTPTPPFPGLVDSVLPKVFNIEVSGAAIWLKPWMKRR